MFKSIKLWSLILCLMLGLVSCQTADIIIGNETPDKDWDLIVESGSNTTVNLYATEADEELRAWFSSKFYKHLMETYNITMNIKVLSFDDIVYTLEQDILNEVKDGGIDLLVLKDDEFRKLKEKNLLYPGIADKIPNMAENINVLDMDVSTEHGYPLDQYAVAFGREQMVLVFDEDVLENYPMNTEELMSFLEENPGRFTYPNPITDEVGGEFVRTVIYEIIGAEKIEMLITEDMTQEEIKTLIMPALDYLKALDDYLFKDDGKYFKHIEDVDQAFFAGDLYFTISSDFAYVTDAINNEYYPEGAKNFIFEEGTIMDTLYFAVPVNASNKTGSIISIHEMLSVDLQLDKYVPSNWGNLPILETNLMSEIDAEKFSKASVKRNTVRVEELAANRYYELPQHVIDIINVLWQQHLN